MKVSNNEEILAPASIDEQKSYTDIVHNEFIEGISFKYKRINPTQHIALATEYIENERFQRTKGIMPGLDKLILKCLYNIIWSNGNEWNTLIDTEGETKLKALDNKPHILYDLYNLYVNEVLNPVFFESKTFQSIMKVNTPRKKT